MANKFNAKKIEYDGHIFDSKKECEYYKKLLVKLENNEITNLELQKTYVLIDKKIIEYIDEKGKTKTKTLFRETTYKADFVYKDNDGNTHVIDVKGCKFGAAYQLFKLKQKMLYDKFNLLVEEV